MSAAIQIGRVNALNITCILFILMNGGCALDDRTHLELIEEPPIEGVVQVQLLTPAGHQLSGDDFLPSPVNICRLSGVENDVTVALLAGAMAQGSVLGIVPVAALQLDSNGIARHIVIAIPQDTALRSVNIVSLEDLLTEYEPVRNILQSWFVNHRGFGAFKLTRWHDERYAANLLGTRD